mmetsp:Transcript_57793/g.66522  ORF Transcript_57793/g.66522 Transcript_57793/m.66522 type:complete len:210 (+) Transcript_57793:744-1373(+)
MRPVRPKQSLGPVTLFSAKTTTSEGPLDTYATQASPNPPVSQLETVSSWQPTSQPLLQPPQLQPQPLQLPRLHPPRPRLLPRRRHPPDRRQEQMTAKAKILSECPCRLCFAVQKCRHDLDASKTVCLELTDDPRQHSRLHRGHPHHPLPRQRRRRVPQQQHHPGSLLRLHPFLPLRGLLPRGAGVASAFWGQGGIWHAQNAKNHRLARR